MPGPILVIGHSGQVARRLIERAAARGIPLIAVGRPELDLADASSVAAAFAAHQPSVVINAAAYTAVDKAESEPEAAFAINAEAVGRIAEQARQAGVPFLHISTDYVFDGTKDGAYLETDQTCPMSVYGGSKRAGEEAAVAAYGEGSAIFRTSWVYDSAGQNFVRTMLRLAADRPTLKVIDDQIGAPTSARSLSDALLDIAETVQRDGFRDRTGIYHLTGGGETSWFGFASAIFEEAAKRGLPSASVLPITSAEYPVKAVRPKNSRLSPKRLQADYGIIMADWRDELAICMDEIVETAKSAAETIHA